MELFCHSSNAVLVHFQWKCFEWWKRNMRLWKQSAKGNGKPNYHLVGCQASTFYLKMWKMLASLPIYAKLISKLK